MLARNNINPLPECSSLMELANDFNIFFAEKIATIRDNIINTEFNGVKPTPIRTSRYEISYSGNELILQCVLEGDVEKRICKLPLKGCEMDPMPTTLLKQMVKVVTPVITCIINRSLLSGKFYKGLKVAHVKPLIKKKGMEAVFKSFCPG